MEKPLTDNICLRCKGARLLCGKKVCPILMKHSILKSTLKINPANFRGKKDIFGASPPAIFVGHFGYPKVNIGPLLPIGEFAELKDTKQMDSPETWFGKSIDEIIAYRSGMIRSNFSIGVKYQEENIKELLGRLNRTNRKMLESTQELTIASNSVDTEAKLSRVRVSMQYDTSSAPNGPSGRASEIKVIDNVKVLKPVDKVISDRDLKAADAITDYLYKPDEISFTSITRLFSAGLLGEQKNRRLVPTRWSITAVDDIIGKAIIKDIRDYPSIDKYYSFYSEYLDNKFLIILAPGRWSYEMNECWAQQSLWNQPVPGVTPSIINVPAISNDWETELGRKKYASNITGAYYSARKEVEEFLLKSHKQARVFVFREILSGYLVPLGVWVIRETVKNAFIGGWNAPNVQEHESLNDALGRLKSVFNIPFKSWIKSSHLLPYIKTHRTLDQWIL
ncbi:MAG: hypothetical protein ACTSVL_07655 [Promethearchaeota archaeon]